MPFNLFKKKSATGHLGLDWGSKFIKLAQIKQSLPKPIVQTLQLFPVESDPNLTIKNIKAFVEQNKLAGMETYSCLDDSSLKIRKLELPKMPDSELIEAVRWKMRDVVEGSIDEYIVRSSLIPQEEALQNKKITVVGYAIKRAAIATRIQKIESTGLKVSFIEPGIVTLASGIESIHPSDEQWLAGIDLGASKSIMVIMGQGRFYFSRPLVGIQVPKDLQDTQSFQQRLAAEIQNTMDTFSVTFHVEQISRLFISGGGGSIPGVADYLSTNLGITTEVLNPFVNVELPNTLDEYRETSFLFSQAISLALMNL